MAHSYSCTTSNMHTTHSRRVSVNALLLEVFYFYFYSYLTNVELTFTKVKLTFCCVFIFLDSLLLEAPTLVGCGRNSPVPSLAKSAPPYSRSLFGHFCAVVHSSHTLASSRTSHILSGVASYSGTVSPSLTSFGLWLLLSVLLSLFILTIPVDGCSH